MWSKYGVMYARKGVTVENGGKMIIPDGGVFSISGEDNSNGTLTVETGGQIESRGDFNVEIPVTVAGTIKLDCEENWCDFTADSGLTLSGSISVGEGCSMELLGEITITRDGRLNSAGSTELTGSVHNDGALNVAGGELKLSNVGYSVYSAGTIAIAAEAEVYVWGTVLVNSGTISGAGTLNIAVADDATSYDNGIEYVKVEGEQTPSDYSRYRFTHDPAATVDVTLFVGELSYQDGGTCTANINDTTK